MGPPEDTMQNTRRTFCALLRSDGGSLGGGGRVRTRSHHVLRGNQKPTAHEGRLCLNTNVSAWAHTAWCTSSGRTKCTRPPGPSASPPVAIS